MYVCGIYRDLNGLARDRRGYFFGDLSNGADLREHLPRFQLFRRHTLLRVRVRVKVKVKVKVKVSGYGLR
jgi:hypothetical protein